MRRYVLPAWLAFQAAIVAMAAWLVANLVHADARPFFAPVAAVVALTAPRGQRGLKAVHVLLGVFLGIVVGEIVVAAMGAGYGRLAIATFIALAIATFVGNARMSVTQAGTSAVLTVIAAQGHAGWQRLLDAAIGGGVALLFTQVVFSPEPVSLLRQAETEALKSIARGLAQAAEALRAADEKAAERALLTLWALPGPLGELARLRKAGSRTARHSAIWQSQRDAVAREQEHVDRIVLIADASVMLARTAFDVAGPARAPLAERIQSIADVLARLGAAPGDRAVRQQAVGDAIAATRPLGAGDPADPNVVIAVVMLGTVARDILRFAGLTASEAADAIRGERTGAEVPHPPAAPRLPFGLDRRRGERRRGSARGRVSGERRASGERRSPGELPDRHPDLPDRRVEE